MNIHISPQAPPPAPATEEPSSSQSVRMTRSMCSINFVWVAAKLSTLPGGLHCGTIVHIIGDEQRTYLVVKGTDQNRALRLSRANGWHGDSEILMLCNSRISVLIRIKEELHSTRLYYVQACRVLGSNMPILFCFQDHLKMEIKSNTACPIPVTRVSDVVMGGGVMIDLISKGFCH